MLHLCKAQTKIVNCERNRACGLVKKSLQGQTLISASLARNPHLVRKYHMHSQVLEESKFFQFFDLQQCSFHTFCQNTSYIASCSLQAGQQGRIINQRLVFRKNIFAETLIVGNLPLHLRFFFHDWPCAMPLKSMCVGCWTPHTSQAPAIFPRERVRYFYVKISLCGHEDEPPSRQQKEFSNLRRKARVFNPQDAAQAPSSPRRV